MGPAGAYAIGAAAVDVLDLHSGAGALVVGRDMRVSGPLMAGAFIDGVLSRGVDVIDIGLSSTDQLWFASGWLDLPGAMFTASHNPADYNGIKFCLAAAKPITSASLTEIADRASGPEPTPVADTREAYRAGRAARVRRAPAFPGRPDRHSARSGSWPMPATGWPVSRYLRCSVVDDLELIGLFTELDGSFPNHPPNPLEPQNLIDAQAAVKRQGG